MTRPVMLLAIAGLALALTLYLPWEHRPFDILDFSEFLPFLRGHSGIVDRVVALVHYYAFEHGRFNLLSYVALGAKWTLLGDVPVRWQWLRFIEMSALAAGTFGLARRLGADVVGAWAGAMLFVCSRSAAEGWTRLTMGEPLGLACLLAAGYAADRYRRSNDRWRAPVIAGLIALAILAKEMLIGAVPFVFLLALCRDDDGHVGVPTAGPRAWRLIRWTSAVVLPVLAVIGWIARRGSAEGFGASYGTSIISLDRFITLWQRGLAPIWLGPGLENWLLPVNLLWLGLVIGGGITAYRVPATRGHIRGLILLALGLPAINAILYLPWPYFQAYYVIPMLVGPALLTAAAVTALREHTPLTRLAATAGVAAFVALSAPYAGWASRIMTTRQRVQGALAGRLASFPDVDSIIVANPVVTPEAWQGSGPTLARYAVARGLASTLPPAADAPCAEVGEAAVGHGPHLLITYSDRCGRFARTTERIIGVYRHLDWRHFGLVTDSLEADLLVPARP